MSTPRVLHFPNDRAGWTVEQYNRFTGTLRPGTLVVTAAPWSRSVPVLATVVAVVLREDDYPPPEDIPGAGRFDFTDDGVYRVVVRVHPDYRAQVGYEGCTIHPEYLVHYDPPDDPTL